MSRSSPSVRRVAAILNFIADHPGQSFALTDLVRALKLSRATCHALLTGLVEVGYLYRTSNKNYVLGPALAAIGRTAAEHFSPLQVAKPEMRALSDEFDILCGAYFLEGDELLIRERTASASHVAYPIPLGARIRMHVSIAPAFFSRTEQEEANWLRTAGNDLTAAEIDRFHATAKFAREHGYIVILRKESAPLDDFEFDQKQLSEVSNPPIESVTALQGGKAYRVASIMSPIFDDKGRVIFALGMVGFYNAMNAEQVRRAGTQLREACARISDFVAGRSDNAA